MTVEKTLTAGLILGLGLLFGSVSTFAQESRDLLAGTTA